MGDNLSVVQHAAGFALNEKSSDGVRGAGSQVSPARIAGVGGRQRGESCFDLAAKPPEHRSAFAQQLGFEHAKAGVEAGRR